MTAAPSLRHHLLATDDEHRPQEINVHQQVPNDTVTTVSVRLPVATGAAGCLVALYYTQIDYTMGFSAGIKAFAAAVLGGIGSIRGAMAGGLVLGVTEAFAATFMSAAYKDLIAFSLLVLVLAIRPAGLLGRKTLERV